GPRGGRRSTTPVERAKVTFEWPSPIGSACSSAGPERSLAARNSRSGSITSSGSRRLALASSRVRTTSSGARVTAIAVARVASPRPAGAETDCSGAARRAGADDSVKAPAAELLAAAGQPDHDRAGPGLDGGEQPGEAVTHGLSGVGFVGRPV